MIKLRKVLFFYIALVWVFPTGAFAFEDTLGEVYAKRADLQKIFNEQGAPRENGGAGFLMNLEDWARQYGWKEEKTLAIYRSVAKAPVQIKILAAPKIQAVSWIVVDKNSGQILSASHAEDVWPIASITKLMTADIVSERANLQAWQTITKDDNVGGANLSYAEGQTFRVEDLLYAALVGSANNAAHAVSRLLGVSESSFVDMMNEKAKSFGLSRTVFADPTGIKTENVSTAREVAYFAEKVWENETLRKMSGTYRKQIADTDGRARQVTTTNWMIWKPRYKNVWVDAGKTGYLNESMWNVVEMLRPSSEDSERELVIVVFGAQDRISLFDSVSRLAKWTWSGWEWGSEFH